LTEAEHALVRQAAARADRSVSRFSVESIIAAARDALAGTATEGVPVPQGEPGGSEEGEGTTPRPKARQRGKQGPAKGKGTK
jgi:hypothetical protein